MSALYRAIVNFPCGSLADVKAKAAYAARLMSDCEVDLEEEIRDGVNDDTFPLVVIRDLLALGDAARA